MSNILKKHRVIGIRHTLKQIKDAGLISKGVVYPVDAVDELRKTYVKASTAKRHRTARSNSSISTVIKNIESVFNLPQGSVQLLYPSGNTPQPYNTVGFLRKRCSKTMIRAQ